MKFVPDDFVHIRFSDLKVGVWYKIVLVEPLKAQEIHYFYERYLGYVAYFPDLGADKRFLFVVPADKFSRLIFSFPEDVRRQVDSDKEVQFEFLKLPAGKMDLRNFQVVV